jgi:hypothetical protein
MYDGVWRSGDKLVMRRDAVLPNRCVRTGRPAEGEHVDLTLHSHHPALYLALLGHLGLYAILATVMGKKARVRVGVCADARRSQASTNAVCWLLAMGGSTVALVSGVLEWPWWFVLGGVAAMLAAAPVFLWGGARLVTASRMDGEYVWLSGVHPHFLATLPSWQGE